MSSGNNDFEPYLSTVVITNPCWWQALEGMRSKTGVEAIAAGEDLAQLVKSVTSQIVSRMRQLSFGVGLSACLPTFGV